MNSYEEQIKAAADELGLGDQFLVPNPEIMDKIVDCLAVAFGESPEAWRAAWIILQEVVLSNMDGLVSVITDRPDAAIMAVTHFCAIIGSIMTRMHDHPMMVQAREMGR